MELPNKHYRSHFSETTLIDIDSSIMALPRLSRSKYGELTLHAMMAIIIGCVIAYACIEDSSFRHFIFDNGASIPSLVNYLLYHLDYSQLGLSMMAIHRYGKQLFVHPSSRKCWQSVWVIIVSFLICGMGASVGFLSFLAYHGPLDPEILRVVIIEAPFIVGSPFGPSSVAYGLMGMRLVTALLSSSHSRLNGLDLIIVVAAPVRAFYFLWLSKSEHSSKSVYEFALWLAQEGIGENHVLHFGSVVVCVIWALLIIILDGTVRLSKRKSSR